MRLNDLLAILRRLRLLTAVCAVVTLVATAGAYAVTPVSYSGSAQVFLLPSAVSAETGKVNNPYLGFGQSLRITAEVLSRLVSTAEATSEAKKHGATAGYLVGIPTDAAGPVLNIVAKGPDRGAVVTTVNYVAAQLGTLLDDEQRKGGAPRSSWFVLNPITESPIVTVDQKARYTRAAGALAVFAVLSLLGIILLDRARSRRRGGAGFAAGADDAASRTAAGTATGAGPRGGSATGPTTAARPDPGRNRGDVDREDSENQGDGAFEAARRASRPADLDYTAEFPRRRPTSGQPDDAVEPPRRVGTMTDADRPGFDRRGSGSGRPR
ncbi:hypothetical protein [Pseudofrankia asymbiotica]|uniref:Polysaccharide chain length determinant N-terminal domain-containing protein n=1 Tax=Pseudofrankia asymbiotica TaxID=1834516 RepID=A0A1V2I9B7_9ACTN|nr:hypothetical protein [Pseudofrankia asymbiotica]ONH28976.1 hypothetical protein BL253_18015 [Pseudofrankia asymbiotica]